MTAEMEKAAADYIAHGWALTPVRGKRPYLIGWGKLTAEAAGWRDSSDGIGLILGRSGVASIDVDDIGASAAALGAINISLRELLEAPGAVRIVSREGRAKLLYMIPDGWRDTVNRKRALNWRRDDGTSYCVIEFRAGSQQLQDVLPPSVHPDTGKPYEWRGDWRNLPDLPDELCKVWASWDVAHSAMVDADPNRTQAPKIEGASEALSRPRAAYTGNSVIDAFNDAFCASDVLRWPDVAAKYAPNGRRYIYKGSTSGLAGGVLLHCNVRPGKLVYYSHNQSDPLHNRCTDAFGVYLEAVHKGRMIDAVKSAAGMLGMEREIERMPEIRVHASPPTSYDNVNPGQRIAPPDAGVCPVGLVEDLFAWIAGSVGRPAKRTLAVQSGLALICHMASRRYKCESGRTPELFCAAVDSATINLGPYMRAVETALGGCGEYQASGDREIPYTAEVPTGDLTTIDRLLSHYLVAPRALFISSSFATYLEREGRQISPTFLAMLDRLCRMRHSGSLRQRYGKDYVHIEAPSVCGLWAFTEHTVRPLVTTTSRSGLCQVTLTAVALDEDAHPSPLVGALHRDIVNRLRAVASGQELGAYQPVSVRVEAAASDMIDGLRDDISASCGPSDGLREHSLRGCRVGWGDAAESICIGLAAMRDPAGPVITRDIAQWACAWVWSCWQSFLPLALHAPGSDTDIDAHVLAVLRKAGAAGATTSELKRSRAALSDARNRQAFDETMQGLITGGSVVHVRIKGGHRYYIARHAPKNDAACRE